MLLRHTQTPRLGNGESVSCSTWRSARPKGVQPCPHRQEWRVGLAHRQARPLAAKVGHINSRVLTGGRNSWCLIAACIAHSHTYPILHCVVLICQAPNTSDAVVNQSASSSTAQQQQKKSSSSVETAPLGEEQEQEQQQESSSSSEGFLQHDPSLLRRILSSNTAADAYEVILQHQGQKHHAVTPADVDLLLRCSLEAANADLALSIYQQLCAAKRAQAAGGSAAPPSTWPAATLQHTETLIKGLCRQLRVNDALTTLRSIRSQGVPGSEEVGCLSGLVVSQKGTGCAC